MLLTGLRDILFQFMGGSDVNFDSRHTNTMADLETSRNELMKKNPNNAKQWNEIALNRYGVDGKPIRPTYLVTFGDVNQITLDAAKALGVDGKPLPILALNKNAISTYASLGTDPHSMTASEVISKYDTLSSVGFDFRT